MPPARKVVTRSPKRTVGLINCPWFQAAAIEHESRLEKHFVMRAMLFPGLKLIEHQPFRLDLSGNGQSYTPDFLLTCESGWRAVVEVKRSEKVKPLKSRFDEISALFRARGLPFYVVHHGQIEGERRAERACLIRRYGMLRIPAELNLRAVEYVQARASGVSIKTLMHKTGISRPQMYHLLAHRQIAINPRLLLSEGDLVFPINKEKTHAHIQFGDWFGCAPWRSNT